MRFVMILNRRGAVILLHVLAVLVVVKSHVCLLKKRPDPSLGGTLRWSLLFDEICYCQGVVAPIFTSQDTCSIKDEACIDGNACNLWFLDDPTPLTQRQNWNKDTLDMLLERDLYCKEAIKAETEGASLSQKTDVVEVSSSTDQEETTQVGTEGATSSQKTYAVEASTSTDQEETTQAETNGASSSQKTDAVEASTSADQEETTQAETEESGSSQRIYATEASASADQACASVLPFGMADGTIQDASITASSDQGAGKAPKYARLGGPHYWISAGDDLEPWIQVDLGSSRRVTGLQTEGNYGGGEWQFWVEQLKVKVGMSEVSLVFIEDINGQPMVFDANPDPYNVADVILDENGIMTRLFRIYPINCKTGGKHSPTCLMRFEVLGCLES